MKKYFWAKLLSCLLLTLIFNPIAECQTAKNLKTKEVKYDKIVLQYSPQGRDSQNKLPISIIFNADNSMLVATDTAWVQAKADTKMLKSLFHLSSNLNFDLIESYQTHSSEPGDYYEFSFLSDRILKKTIGSYSRETTDEMKKICALCNKILATKTITNRFLPTSIEGFNTGCVIRNFFLADEDTNNTINVGQNCLSCSTTNFLLRNYIRKAKVVTHNQFNNASFPYKFSCQSVNAILNNIETSNNLKINGKWETVTKGETDGRYFRFIANSGVSITLDIGFNFFTHTLKKFQDRKSVV